MMTKKMTDNSDGDDEYGDEIDGDYDKMMFMMTMWIVNIDS
jgi:hypothetical protein